MSVVLRVVTLGRQLANAKSKVQKFALLIDGETERAFYIHTQDSKLIDAVGNDRIKKTKIVIKNFKAEMEYQAVCSRLCWKKTSDEQVVFHSMQDDALKEKLMDFVGSEYYTLFLKHFPELYRAVATTNSELVGVW